MPKKWTLEKLQEEALKYKTRSEFSSGSMGAYLSSKRNGVYDKITEHMPIKVDQSGENNSNARWTFEKLQEEALKYKTKNEFKKASPATYQASSRREDHDLICSHMPKRKDISNENNPRFKWTDQMFQEEALKYKTRGEFQKNSSSAYTLSLRKGGTFLDEICPHMELASNSSPQEKELLERIKSVFPKTQKLRDLNVQIPGKPHIHGFEIDVYVPELRRGIEFDGKYHHSFDGLKRGRPKWPDEDILNYHQTKDSWFASKGITILHIEWDDWIEDKESCIKKCLEFLGVETQQKVA